MTELQQDPAIEKLIEYARQKKSITYDEVHDLLPDSIVNSEKIDEVISLLEHHKIKLEEEDVTEPTVEEVKVRPDRRKRLMYGDKESAIDDPIRLYLREIGKENLLTAE